MDNKVNKFITVFAELGATYRDQFMGDKPGPPSSLRSHGAGAAP